MKRALLIVATILALFSFGCQTDPAELEDKRDNLTKNKWSAVLDDGSGTVDSYQVTITKSADDNQIIYLANFINNNKTAVGKFIDMNIVVSQQNLDNYTVEGTGKVSSDYSKITFTNLKIDDKYYTLTLSPGGITK